METTILSVILASLFVGLFTYFAKKTSKPVELKLSNGENKDTETLFLENKFEWNKLRRRGLIWVLYFFVAFFAIYIDFEKPIYMYLILGIIGFIFMFMFFLIIKSQIYLSKANQMEVELKNKGINTLELWKEYWNKNKKTYLF